MPQSRMLRKNRNAPRRGSPHTPLKIGGRKSTVSALRMTNKELLEASVSPNTRPRDMHKIMTVLRMRGMTTFKVVESVEFKRWLKEAA